MNKNFLIVNANYYKDISSGLLKSATNLLPKNSKVKIIPIGKHLCHIECSNKVNNAIKEHIND